MLEDPYYYVGRMVKGRPAVSAVLFELVNSNCKGLIYYERTRTILMNSTIYILSLTRRRIRCQFLFDDVKSSEADTEGDRSFHPVHTHSLEQATDSLLAQNMC